MESSFQALKPEVTNNTAFFFRSEVARRWGMVALLLPALVLWGALYLRLGDIAVWIVYHLLHFPRIPGELHPVYNGCCGDTRLAPALLTPAMRQGRALGFVLFQIPHTLMLLIMVVFLMGIVRSFFSPERARALLAGRRTVTGKGLAALLGVVTPFCSCSAVPLFIGFVSAGVPLGITFIFLITAPMVNEVALAQLFDSFGWLIALLYAATGLAIAIAAGWLLERTGMHRHVEPWVLEIGAAPAQAPSAELTAPERIEAGFRAVGEILGRVWPYLLAGIVAGTLIFAYLPEAAILALLGSRHWWSVPLAVLVGVPIYANPAGVLPVLQALASKGVPPGTLIAFMMAVVGLSLPEFIILRKVLKPRLLLAFAGLVALGITLVGYLLNWALGR